MADNILYYGDNLDILRRYVKDATVDLVYLDPPFKSDQNYNVLFKEQDGTRAAAQIKAFGDTWSWDQAAAAAWQATVEAGGRVSQVMQAFRTFLGDNDLLAYLSMMAPRLVELRRVLRPTGSIYLHCDPTAGHYLKILMDAIFGIRNFQNEIVWKRTTSHSGSKRWGPVHDTILFYTASDTYTWKRILQPYGKAHLDSKYRTEDERGPYMQADLTGAGTRQGDSGRPWRGIDPTALGRHWAVPTQDLGELLGADADPLTTQEKLDLLDQNGYIYWPSRGRGGGSGFPRFKRYLAGGAPIQDIVDDVPPLNSQAQERLGYPTQKPEALLSRIIRSSSNEGDIVLDPFCGCGTTVHAAQRLGRRWIGIDVTHLAIALIKNRLQDAFGKAVHYKVIGEPVALSDAMALAVHDPYQFQWWALGLAGARPTEQKKGADKGIDGRLYFHDDNSGKTKQAIFSVKAGGTGVAHVRDLRGVLDREKAELGVLITLLKPTQPMQMEAASAGFYLSPGWNKKYPRLQILTVGELISGKAVDMPPVGQVNVTFKKAPKAAAVTVPHAVLPLDGD